MSTNRGVSFSSMRPKSNFHKQSEPAFNDADEHGFQCIQFGIQRSQRLPVDAWVKPPRLGWNPYAYPHRQPLSKQWLFFSTTLTFSFKPPAMSKQIPFTQYQQMHFASFGMHAESWISVLDPTPIASSFTPSPTPIWRKASITWNHTIAGGRCWCNTIVMSSQPQW